MNDVTFNGITASSLGLVVQTPPEEVYAEKDIDLTHIKGRNGDLIIDNGSYMNTTRTYSFACAFNGQSQFVEKVQAITKWLHSANGYARLSDTYSNYYCMAVVKESNSFVNAYNQGTAFVVSFECKPQKYLSLGDDPITVTNTGNWFTFINTTGQIARPEISFDAKASPPDIAHVILFSGIEYYRAPDLDIPGFGYAWKTDDPRISPSFPSKDEIITKSENPKRDTSVYYRDWYDEYGIVEWMDLVMTYIPAGYRFQFIVARDSSELYTTSEHWIVSIDTSVSLTGVINSDLMECYDYRANIPYLINNRIIIDGYPGFPVFYPGYNYVKITLANSENAQLTIKPKYWVL